MSRRRMLITAGPTHEPIDAVRYLANRSSGRLGVCLAEAAREAGWETTLLLGPVAVATLPAGSAAAAPPWPETPAAEAIQSEAPSGAPAGSDAGAPIGIHVVRFESTADLEALLRVHFPECDVLIMAAAVADYRPERLVAGKLPRRGDALMLALEPTPDLVAACAAQKRPEQVVVGFALDEPGVLGARAREKLRQKGLDAIVANPLETMGAEEIRAVVHTMEGGMFAPQEAARLSKREFARWLIRWIERRTA